LKSTLNGASTASFAKTNYYKNLKILPKHPGSRSLLGKPEEAEKYLHRKR